MSRMKDHAIDVANAAARQGDAAPGNRAEYFRTWMRTSEQPMHPANAAPTTAMLVISIAELQAMLDRAKENSRVTFDGKVNACATVTLYAPIAYQFRSNEKVQVTMSEATFAHGPRVLDAAQAYFQ